MYTGNFQLVPYYGLIRSLTFESSHIKIRYLFITLQRTQVLPFLAKLSKVGKKSKWPKIWFVFHFLVGKFEKNKIIF